MLHHWIGGFFSFLLSSLVFFRFFHYYLLVFRFFALESWQFFVYKLAKMLFYCNHWLGLALTSIPKNAHSMVYSPTNWMFFTSLWKSFQVAFWIACSVSFEDMSSCILFVLLFVSEIIVSIFHSYPITWKEKVKFPYGLEMWIDWRLFQPEKSTHTQIIGISVMKGHYEECNWISHQQTL